MTLLHQKSVIYTFQHFLTRNADINDIMGNRIDTTIGKLYNSPTIAKHVILMGIYSRRLEG